MVKDLLEDSLWQDPKYLAKNKVTHLDDFLACIQVQFIAIV